MIDSEFELPELPRATGPCDVLVRLGRVPRDQASTMVDDEVALTSLAGAFHITGGSAITVEPNPGIAESAVRLLLLGKVMAFLLRQRGWLPLHASVVALHGQAVLFLGLSGAGKSTTAAAFYAQGHTVIADDLAAIRLVDGSPVVQSAFPRVRLLDESRSVLEGLALNSTFHYDKHVFPLHRNEILNTYPVRRVYLLEPGEDLHFETIPRPVCMTLFSRHSFVRLRNADRALHELHFRNCAAMADAITIRRLIRPASLGALPQLVRLVEHDLLDTAHDA